MTWRQKRINTEIIKSNKSITIAIIITIFVSAVVILNYLVHDNMKLTDEDSKNMLVAIISISSSGAITCIILYYQDKFQIKRDQMLNTINKISEDQYRRSISLVEGSLIFISQRLDNIQDDLNELKNQNWIPHNRLTQESMKYLKALENEANENKDSLGNIYFEILNVIRLFKNITDTSTSGIVKKEEKEKKFAEIENELYLLQEHIDGLLFDEILDENFQDIDIGKIIRKSRCDILIGHKIGYDEIKNGVINPANNPDSVGADRLIKVLDQRKSLHLRSKKITDNIIDEKKLRNNLIVLGGPRANRLTYKFNKSFILPHLHLKDPSSDNYSDAFYSRVNRNTYYGPDYATIQAIKSPFNSNKIIIFAFGANEDGTTIAVDFLIQVFEQKENDLCLKHMIENKNDLIYPAKYPAKVIKKSNKSHPLYSIEE